MANVNEKVESLNGSWAEALVLICSDCFRLEPILNQKMKNTKKILITTATSEFFIIRRKQQKTIRVFCPVCTIETEMLELNIAVTTFGVGIYELIRQIEKGAIHSVEIMTGHLFVCKESMRQTAIAKTN